MKDLVIEVFCLRISQGLQNIQSYIKCLSNSLIESVSKSVLLKHLFCMRFVSIYLTLCH